MVDVKPIFLIVESHGEYDDFCKIPICTVDDYDLALMIADEFEKALNTKTGEFYEIIKEYCFYTSYDHSFDIECINHLALKGD